MLKDAKNFHIEHVMSTDDIYESVNQDVLEKKIKLEFPCEKHKNEIVSSCIHYYIHATIS